MEQERRRGLVGLLDGLSEPGSGLPRRMRARSAADSHALAT